MPKPQVSQFVPDDERQRLLVLFVGVAKQLAVDHHEIVAEGRCCEGVQGTVAGHQVDLGIPSQAQLAGEVLLDGVDVGELPAREPHRRSSYARAGELTIHNQSRHEEQQRNEGYSDCVDHRAR
jgi:hypothetical protein